MKNRRRESRSIVRFHFTGGLPSLRNSRQGFTDHWNQPRIGFVAVALGVFGLQFDQVTVDVRPLQRPDLPIAHPSAVSEQASDSYRSGCNVHYDFLKHLQKPMEDLVDAFLYLGPKDLALRNNYPQTVSCLVARVELV